VDLDRVASGDRAAVDSWTFEHTSSDWPMKTPQPPPLPAQTRRRFENGSALLIVLRVAGAPINRAQREALTCSTFTKSIANKPL
jgi:hypothetical protein